MNPVLVVILFFVITGLFLSVSFIMYVLGEANQAKQNLKHLVIYMVCWGLFVLILWGADYFFN